jgi:FixJ family two-component response regulator
MPLHRPHFPTVPSSIALVDGDPALRRARLLMLRAEGFEVRAYPVCAALLADPQAFRSTCVIADAEMGDLSGQQLLHAMREAGWVGSAILLADTGLTEPSSAANDRAFVAVLPKTLSDGPLLKAIRSAIAGQSQS